MKSLRFSSFLLLPVLLLSCWASVYAATPEGNAAVIYRYKNAQGITVLDSTIPSEFVSKGYEVLSRSGKVLKVVAPALAPELAAKALAERQAREAQEKMDIELRRSYSNVSDIEAAKARNLESLKGNIEILEANLLRMRSKLSDEQARAAALERTGAPITEDVLNSIAALEQEERDIEAQILQRQQESKEVAAKFDADRKRFLEITKPVAAGK